MAVQRKLTIDDLSAMKQDGEKIAMLTCYDATFATTMDQSGVDIILVGDSLGMVVQGKTSTVGVRVTDIEYHTACVAKGLNRTFLLADMPFGSFHHPTTAMKNAVRLLRAGGEMVKLEGAGPMIEVVDYLTSRGVPVCAHLGLTPQSVNQLGGFKVQARDEAGATQLVSDAVAMQQAGAQMLVVECIPATLGREVALAVDMPVIGIGAGVECDGQVLVMHDMLGLGGRVPRFVKNFMQGSLGIQDAFEAYVLAVREQQFPTVEHEY
ncbi:MAG: 3-methyl-2-oxobutanoate hydroxymethyltransferase [Xanthomonadales bacterium]|jgi:3-methyl-2-oxobutanoate hydroxymethyltransferase|nr:3-methyl-2-oxobutanoate hydroxymethyltransferase [Xanthomonadales bacterium]MDH3941293.1 3-methyl-2-oxobutanoate hydroxymethyltransferase [Xanthomonadales bacterium]MDH4001195.1 3-methyl-2-oxobutanoate hydroxymethyltransferase [Xanthomonadales bacterium]